MNKDTTLLRGRFAEATDAFVEAFTASVDFDRRLYRQDIRGSIAHCRMLAHVGVLTDDEAERIVAGLQAIHKEIDEGRFEWQVALEDVHMNVEARLIDMIGETGKKLHTARSRNDQIATDIRLWLRDAIDELAVIEVDLLNTLLDVAERHAGTIMPGFTHLQAAQPVTFGHHLLAWFEMLLRDLERLRAARERVDVLPLGAAALAGTTFPIDRDFVAHELGFAAVCANSLDAVSDRDFAIEFVATASITMMHLSRWCEELVLWSSQRFAFVKLPDRFCTGSSIMPQKKNPDVPELVRGKTGRVYGHLVALLTLMKSQPLAYNKDNQEDKEPVFDAVDTLGACLTAMRGIVAHLEPQVATMRAATEEGYATATDLADYLVRRGLPFRAAHEVVGRAVLVASKRGVRLDQLGIDELTALAPEHIGTVVLASLSVEGSVAARNHPGGTAPAAVRAAVVKGRARIPPLS
jgi:argininosuccinate lyase